MAIKQQIALFESLNGEYKRPSKNKPAAVPVPESEIVAKLKDEVQRLEYCLLDTVVLASEYVEAAYWSKFLKRTNLNFEQHNLRKILLRNNDFVFVKGRPQREPETNP